MVGSLAQLAEHLTLNQGVTGSIPVRSTIFIWAINSVVECHLHTVEVVGSNPISPTIVITGPLRFFEGSFFMQKIAVCRKRQNYHTYANKQIYCIIIQQSR